MSGKKRFILITLSFFILALNQLTSAQTVTRGPYLQIGTPNSIVIRWRTSAATNSRVRYGSAPGSLTSAVDDPTATTEHVVQLNGLSPDTQYYYSIGTTSTVLAGDDANCFFVTSPVPGASKPTRVWVLGDAGTATSNQRAVRDAYYNFTGSRHTELWMMLGDNAYSSGTDAEYQAAVFQDMYEAMLRKSVLWPTRGNHDSASPSSGSGTYYDIFTLPKNGEAGGLASGTEVYYSFDYGNIHFICLESTSSSYRAANGAMVTWLRADLAANDKNWTIAFWHHPPYSKGSHDSDSANESADIRANILPVLEAGGVDLVLCGHSHSYERSFMLNGHYGTSNTLTNAMKIDAGNGRENGNGAYSKNSPVPIPNAGAVYMVAGTSGHASGGSLNHPVMVTSLSVIGSVVLDLNGSRLDATFIDNNGTNRDYFTILKGPGIGPATQLVMVSGDQQTAPASSALPNPFVVEVRDANNNPVPGAQVEFAVNTGGGILSNSQPQVTGSNGRASTVLTLGTAVGTNTVTATATDLTGSPLVFTATGNSTPILTDFSPSKARVGATVTLTGKNFSAATQVAFNGVATTNFTIDSNTQISVIVPTGTTTGKISVTSPDGPGVSASNFTIQYLLSITMDGSGSVSLTPAGNVYDGGTVVKLTAAPALGFQFSGWSGDLNSATNPATITMDADKNITATFLSVPPVPLTVNIVGPGTVTLNPPDGTYPVGTMVTLTATPNAGYQFSGWSGDLTGATNPATMTMNAAKGVTATFVQIIANIVHQETKTGSSSSSKTLATSSSLTAANNHVYLAAMVTRPRVAVSSISGLGLTWSLVKSQCAGRNQTGVEVWKAQGTPSGNGKVTATLASKPDYAVIAVSRYSGVAINTLDNVVSANSLGTSAACAGGVDNSSYSFNLTTTVNGAAVYNAVAIRDATHTPGAGYTERAELIKGSSTKAAGIAVESKSVTTPSAVTVNGTFKNAIDWAAVAVELKPQVGASAPKFIAKTTAVTNSLAPAGYRLEQNHPNPFNPATSIRYTLPQAGPLRLTIYDINGRIVKILFEGFREAGAYTQVWDAVNFNDRPLPSGVYYGQLRAAEYVATIKMLLIR